MTSPADPTTKTAQSFGIAVWLVPLVLSTFLAAQAMLSMASKSVTVDEIMYIAAGHRYLRTGDFAFNATNPPLLKMISAAPLLFFELDYPEANYSSGSSKHIAEWQASRNFLYNNTVDAETILFTARLPIVALSISLGLLVWKWTAELYGYWAAALAHSLYCFSPNVLAHSRLATQDLGLAAVVFASLYFAWRYLSQCRTRDLLACSVLIGLGVTIKTPSLLAIGGMAVYGGIRMLRNEHCGINSQLPFVKRISSSKPRLQQLVSVAWAGVIVAAVAITSVNAVYGFQGIYLASVSGLPCPLPESFAQSLRFQSALKAAPSSVFFAGSYYVPGLWYKHLVAFLIKTPLPALALMFLGFAYMLRRVRTWNAEWILVGSIAVFLAAFAWLSNIGGSLRYILAIYPLLFTITGSLLQTGSHVPRLLKSTVAALVIWYVAGGLYVHPHYLAYFNELAGGSSQGYRWLSDSDIDWGQDLKGLRQYMAENSIEKVSLAYFGSADAEYYGIDYDYLPSVGLAPQSPDQDWWYDWSGDTELERPKGTVAISATLLASGKEWMRPFRRQYAWLLDEEPIGSVGHTILIYQVD